MNAIQRLSRMGIAAAVLLSVLVGTAACATPAEPTVAPTPEASQSDAASDAANPSDAASDAATTQDTSEAKQPYYMEDIELVTLEGDTVSLHDYKGDFIILNFWATWCGYCKEELPLLNALNAEDGVTVLAISAGESQKTVSDFLKGKDIDMPVFLDESGALSRTYGVSGLPTNLFIGEDMELYYIQPGMLTREAYDEIRAAIDDLLKSR